MATCTTHTWLEATGTCVACGRPFCENCLAPFLGQPHCAQCRERRLAEVQGAGPAVADGPLSGTNRVEIGDWVSRGWQMTKESGGTFIAAMLVAGLLSVLSIYICAGAFACGLYLMCFRKMRTGQVSVGNLFDGFRRFGNGLLTLLLVIAAQLGAEVLVGLPFGLAGVASPRMGQQFSAMTVAEMLVTMVVRMFVGGAVMFALPHVAARNVGAVEAIRASWDVFRRNPLMFAVAYLAINLAAALGVLLCGIGIFITLPIAVTAVACAYADHFGLTSIDL